MHDHRTGYRFCISNEQRLDVFCDPGERAPVGLLSLFAFVEDADRGHAVVTCIDDVIGHETLDIADDGNGTLFDPACQFLGASSLCLGLTDGGIHEILLPTGTSDACPVADVKPYCAPGWSMSAVGSGAAN